MKELSSLNFAFNNNELVIAMVFNKSKMRIISPDPICAREKRIIEADRYESQTWLALRY